jgi:CheY-like chemotaxis protein
MMVHCVDAENNDDFVMLRAVDALGPIAHPRVLVVDDYPAGADALKLLLEQNGFEVRSACDARTARRIAQQWLPFAALVDLAIPGVSGVELGRQLTADRPTGNILLAAFDASSSALRRCQAREAGFHVYCLKPLAPLRLLTMLRSFIGK